MAFVTIAPPAQPGPSSASSSPSWAGDKATGRKLPNWLAWSVVPSHALLVVLAVASIFPVYWMFVTAFRPAADSLSTNPLPGPFSFENFQYVLDTIPIAGMMANTFGMALALSVSQLLLAVLASYGFARWGFFGKKVLYLLFVGSWLVPFQVTMIPNYLLVSQMGLLNTVTGVVLPQLCSAFA